MINGQKVIKVFCHEEKAKEGFDKINDKLNEHTYKANKFANVLMPILIALGNMQYALVAIARWSFSIKWNWKYFNWTYSVIFTTKQNIHKTYWTDFTTTKFSYYGTSRWKKNF